VDDLGWNNVGWHNKDMLTPNADGLVAQGIELDRHCDLSQFTCFHQSIPIHRSGGKTGLKLPS